jgi:hypothetical protein
MNAPPPVLCPNCGSAMPEGGYCPNCGYAMYTRAAYPYRRRSGCLGGIVFAVGLFLFLLGVGYALLVAIVAACSAFGNGRPQDTSTPLGAILLMICGATGVVAAIVIWIRNGAKNRLKP